MTRSSEHQEPGLYLNASNLSCPTAIAHLGETLGRLQMGHCKATPPNVLGTAKKCLWLECSSPPAYPKPETSNSHTVGTNRNGASVLT